MPAKSSVTMNNPYQFQNLSGLAPVAWTGDLHFVGTGMTWDYDMRRMSTGDNRRDFGPGISGNQFSAKVETSFTELKLNPPYPADSYHITLKPNLRLLDMRNVPDPMFSGKYYDENRSHSCEMLSQNLDYLHANGFDGIVRFSKPALGEDRYEIVVAVTPDAIGKMAVKEVDPLGNCSGELNIINPDGSKVPMRDFYPKS
jgi:hypothetical protein